MDAWIGRKNTFEFSNSNQNIQKKHILPITIFYTFPSQLLFLSSCAPESLELFRSCILHFRSCTQHDTHASISWNSNLYHQLFHVWISNNGRNGRYCLAQKRWCWFNALHHKVEPYVRMGIVPLHMLTQSRYYHETIPPQYKYLERCIIVTS